ncbi:thioredoxin domain protein [Formosa agariphila KMM 3901]|uniref:Thioredoxin domain protein n=1 Tax=Formosa agariphila (strain DSM 15362 / KCTC 12365 / LMG 23005 / KMM 3901 / M-2Alg 35-1) TaxID=1347342 RepID=T2KNM8_FORAG|nr:TlpA disulfide reductase family protein [Formosa agariphila]CDF80056.1 thioredoxin domain protein [Formosa agariphila KMM 3901]
MKKIFIALSALSILACQEAPKKDYVTLSGKIIDKNSDSLVIRSRTYNKTIQVNADGTFSDTLKVEAGLYNLFDGGESSTVFLRNGYDLNISLDTKEFDESIAYTGEGAENNNFLAENSLKQEALMDQDFSSMDLTTLDETFTNIESELTAFYNSKQGLDTMVTQSVTKNLQPMLEGTKKYFAGNIALKQEMTGKPSPLFVDYENVDGSKTSLESLRGKYVYIDVWATWCAPCKAEIPALKELEEAYREKNITFVSLSVDDDRSHGGSWDKAKEDWLAMVNDKELSGVQVMAPEGWKSQFVRDYKINGIPRFILIDPAGNIVDPSAPRPSDKKLKELFTSLSI